MKVNTKVIGLFAGLAVGLLFAFLPFEGLSREGQLCMAFSFMTVVFWGFQIAQSGYISALYLVLLVVFKVAEPGRVFSLWTESLIYLIIGAYLIAGAVKDSGLGDRIAYNFILKFVTSFKSIIISIFVLTFILSLLIPHPWPRAFLIMSVMGVIIKSANIPKKEAITIGFTVFAASVPVSLIFLTGDAVISPLAINLSGIKDTGVNFGWLDWFKYMGPPSILVSIITCIMILLLFKPTQEIEINKVEIRAKLDGLGKLTKKEIRVLFWIVLAIILWMTDKVHGIDIGWITIIIAVCMSLPLIGEVLTPASWSGVPIHVLLFLTAAVAIGRIGGATGMNAFIANAILPDTVPANPLVLAAFITLVSVVIHMILGSCIAVMGIVIPAILMFTQPMGYSPLVPALLAYSAVASHYILPFQHLNMLVGVGEQNGGYSQKETVRLGIPFIIVVFIMTVLFEMPWWKLLGLY